MIFTDRGEAGRRLAEALADEPVVTTAARLVVLAVPRGGLPVALEVAHTLGADLEVAVARELRAPHDPDVAFGAVGADGHVEVDEPTVERLGLAQSEVDAELARRRAAVERRLVLYRQAVEPVDLDGAVVIVVDDGIASGGTARQACALARRGGAGTIILAAPVAPAEVEVQLADVADRFVVLTNPAEFLAVGQAYQDFPRLEDDEVLELLLRHGAPADAQAPDGQD